MAKIKSIIKKGIGSKLKENLGLAAPEKELPSEKIIKYSKKVYSEKQEKKAKVTARQLFENFKPTADTITNNFIIDVENEELIKVLCMYFAGDDNFTKYNFKRENVKFIHQIGVSGIKNKPELGKGLLIMGSYGFGKSLIMQTFKKMSIPGNSFFEYHANDIAIDYSKLGYVGIENQLNGHCAYDDLGAEDKAGHYEKQKEIFRIIIENRYTKFLRNKWKTHGTTNLDPSDLLERYGGRADSRIYEMFNIIIVGGADRRKE